MVRKKPELDPTSDSASLTSKGCCGLPIGPKGPGPGPGPCPCPGLGLGPDFALGLDLGLGPEPDHRRGFGHASGLGPCSGIDS